LVIKSHLHRLKLYKVTVDFGYRTAGIETTPIVQATTVAVVFSIMKLYIKRDYAQVL
jgi:hypothetical protein